MISAQAPAMTKLSDEIKRALSALAYQDAGEFLTTRDKIELLGDSTESQIIAEPAKRSATNPALSNKRIALLTDGSNSEAAFTYAIETAIRLEVKIDLLTHSVMHDETHKELDQRISDVGIFSRRVPLVNEKYDGILSYLNANPALIFLIASVNDTIAKTLAEEVFPNQLCKVPVPLVLINDNQSPNDQGKNAA
jgi:hypothetical protein